MSNPKRTSAHPLDFSVQQPPKTMEMSESPQQIHKNVIFSKSIEAKKRN